MQNESIALKPHASRHPLPPRAQRLVRIATWVPLVVLGLMTFLFAYLGWAWLSGSNEPAELAATAFGMQQQEALFLRPENRPAVGFAMLVWMASLSSIIVALLLSFQLLRDYAAGRIFHLKQAMRLRRIGWMMVLAAPLMVAGKSIGHLVLGLIANPNALTFSVGIEHVDLLMLAFGLLIVVVGHVMHTALAIAEENENFV